MRISDWSSDVCSSDLSRTRTSKGSPVAWDWATRRVTGSMSSGWVAESQPDPSASSRSRPELSSHRSVKSMIRPSASRSEEHTSELQSLMRISYAVFCLKKKKKTHHKRTHTTHHNNTKYRSSALNMY